MAFEFLKDNINLFNHQIDAIKFMSKEKKGLIALPTGSGKTLMSLVYSLELLKKGVINRIIWVTLPSISHQVEESLIEFIDSDFLKENVRLVDLSPMSKNQRKAVYNKLDDYNFIVINYEKLRMEVDYLYNTLTDDNLIILDEVQKAKNPNSQTGKAIVLLSSKAKRLLALTATPVMKDLWDLVNILNVTFIMEINPIWFKNTFCKYKTIRIRPIKKGNKIIKQIQKFDGYVNVKDFYKFVSNKCFFRNKKDIMQMPPVSIYTLYHKSINKDIKEAIEALSNQYIFEGRGIPISLLEIAETAPYLILKRKAVAPKINLVVDWVEENVDNKVIIYTQYKSVAKYTQKFIKKYYQQDSLVITGDETSKVKEIKDQFLNSDIKFLIATDTISTGFDGLQKVANTIVLLTLPDTIGQYTQLIGRIYRTGQKADNINIVVPIVNRLVSNKKWFSLHSTASLLFKTNKSQLEAELFDKYLIDTISDSYNDKWIKSEIEKKFKIKIDIDYKK